MSFHSTPTAAVAVAASEIYCYFWNRSSLLRKQHLSRVLDVLLDLDEEGDGLPAVK